MGVALGLGEPHRGTVKVAEEPTIALNSGRVATRGGMVWCPGSPQPRSLRRWTNQAWDLKRRLSRLGRSGELLIRRNSYDLAMIWSVVDEATAVGSSELPIPHPGPDRPQGGGLGRHIPTISCSSEQGASSAPPWRSMSPSWRNGSLPFVTASPRLFSFLRWSRATFHRQNPPRRGWLGLPE